MYTEFDARHFRKMMACLEGHFETVAAHGAQLSLPESARTVAEAALPQDDSAFQWGAEGFGVSPNLPATVEQTFERFVTHHEKGRSERGRTDEQVWGAFRRAVRDKPRLRLLAAKRITTQDDEIAFDYAWMNGKWHCLEPLSFDLQKTEKICEKAHTWLGRLTSVAPAESEFKVYFLVGRPKREEALAAYNRALRILEKATVEHEIFLEEHQEKFNELITALVPEPPDDSGPPGSSILGD
jgi:hypothetical protein